jgi:hypothetical protein
MSDKLLHKYYLRLKTEGLLKALLWGLAVGFGVLAVLGMLYWLMDWKSEWVSLVVAAVVTVGATCIFYHWIFKPTTKYIARRVDDLGLHERILTMTELEGDESYIARRQREDALAALRTVRVELLKIGVSTTSIITTAATALLGVFGFLFAAGVFKSYAEINPVEPDMYTITYAVKDEKGGTIEGIAEQTVAVGEMTEGVIAVPEDGWRFWKWTVQESGKFVDDLARPYRSDEVVASKKYLAVFVEIALYPIENPPEDKPTDAPGDGEEESDDTQDGEPDPEKEQDPTEYEEVNQVIDGSTYYGNLYEEYYKDAIEDLMDEKYTGDQKEMGGGYFDDIEKGETEEENNN